MRPSARGRRPRRPARYFFFAGGGFVPLSPAPASAGGRAHLLVPVATLPTSRWRVEPPVRRKVTSASGLSRPVSAGVLPSPKSSAVRVLNARSMSLTFSPSKRSIALVPSVPTHLPSPLLLKVKLPCELVTRT